MPYKIVNKPNDKQLKEMIRLDKEVFSSTDIGVFEKCKDWLTANPEIYTILTHKAKVVGYINFVPVTDEFYARFKTGKIKDFELSSKDITGFSNDKPIKCLFTSIVVDKNYRNGKSFETLWYGFLEKLRKFNIEVSSIIMDCVTDIGELCAKKFLNGNYICNSSNGKIYEGKLNLKKE